MWSCLARTKRLSRPGPRQPAGGGQGRWVPHLPHSIRGSCLGASGCAHGATARLPGPRPVPRCVPLPTRHTCRPIMAKIASPSRSPAAASLKARMLREGIECRHKRIALFSSFALYILVPHHVRRRCCRARCKRWHCRKTGERKGGVRPGPDGTGALPAWPGAIHDRRRRQRRWTARLRMGPTR